AARIQQTEEVVKDRQRDPVLYQIQDWLAALKAHKRRPRAKGPAPITGTVLADLSDQEAERLRRELPHVSVSPGRPPPVIEPDRHRGAGGQATTAKLEGELKKADLWHLQSIGINDGRGKRKVAQTGKGVTVAVLDTGVDESHAALQGKVTGAFTFQTATW